MDTILKFRREGLRALMERHGLSHTLVFNAEDGILNTWLLGREQLSNGPGNPANLPTLAPFNRSSVYIVPAEGEILCYSGIQPHPTDPRQYPLLPADALKVVFSPGRLGTIHPAAMKQSLMDALAERWPGLELVDITPEFEALKAHKCDEETAEMARAAACYDRCFTALPLLLRPGRTEHDAAIDLRFRLAQLGASAEDLNQLSTVELQASADGRPDDAGKFLWPGRTLRYGDRVSVSVFGYLPGGFSSALGRCFVLGAASDAAKTYWSLAVQAQDLAASMLRPGVSLAEIDSALDAVVYAPNGLTRGRELALWGMGVSTLEAPYAGHATADMPLAAGMTIAVGPVIRPDGAAPYRCLDVFSVTERGGERLGRTPRDLIELN